MKIEQHPIKNQISVSAKKNCFKARLLTAKHDITDFTRAGF
jgi:hypothetical protein